MADAITKNAVSGKHEMAYVGEKPWHGLGQELKEGASIETWQTAAGMDWKVQRSKVRYAVDQQAKTFLEVPDKHVLFRSDTHDSLGLVSSRYKVVQPKEVLEFFRDLTEEQGFHLNTAGTLFGGKRFWALARVGKDLEVGRGDKVGGFLLLSTSCDGSLATSARFTSVRVVCNNTLTMAMADRQHEVSIRHRSEFDQAAVKEQLGVATQMHKDFMGSLRHLAGTSLELEQAREIIKDLLVETQTIFKADPFKSRPHQEIMRLYSGEGKGATLPGAKGTAWGLLNAVTEYVDHHARAKTVDARVASAWFGRGDDLKTEAMRRLELVAA